MKVIVLSSHARSLINFRYELSAAMVKGGHRVQAFAPENDPGVAAGMGAIGVMYKRIKLDRTGRNPAADLLTLACLYGLLKRERPDVCFAYTIKAVIYGSLAARMAGVPRMISMVTGLSYAFPTGGPPQGLLNRLAPHLYRLALLRNEAVFFHNSDDLELFCTRKLVPDRKRAVLVNGSGVNLDRFSPMPMPPGPPTFLLLARLLKEKGIAEYAEAARLVKAKYPSCRFLLAGPRDDHPGALPYDRVLGWGSAGILDYQGCVEDVRPLIAASHVYVLPSYHEGLPRSVLEAMAMGRPAITTDVPGCRETVVSGENGWLVPARDAQALANAMERFARQPDLIAPMGRRSRQIAEERYDVHKVNAVMLRTMGLG